MKGFTYPGEAPIKKINLGTFLDPAGIFTGESAPWHPGVLEGLGRGGRKGRGSRASLARRNQMEWNRRYGRGGRGYPRGYRASSWGTGRFGTGRRGFGVEERVVTANRPTTDTSGKKVIVKKG